MEEYQHQIHGYECPIHNVIGSNEFKIQNKNLAWNGWAEDFVKRLDNTTRGSIVDYDNKNCLMFTPNAGWADYDNKYLFKTNFKENTQYTFTFDFLCTTTTNYNLMIFYTDGTSQNVLNSTANTWKKAIVVSQNNKTVKYITSAYYSGNKYIDLDTFMVLEGSYTEETIPSYVEHKEQNLPFSLRSKNLCNLPQNTALPMSANSTTIYKTTNNKTFSNITISFTFQNAIATINSAALINFKQKDNTNNYLTLADLNLPVNTPINGTYSKTYTNITFNRVIAYLGSNYSTFTQGSVSIQLEEGTTATDYEPYYNYELFKIGDAEDYFSKEAGKWYVNKEIGKVVLDGTESWTKYSPSSAFQYTYYLNISNAKKTMQSSMCSHFRNVNYTWGENIGKIGQYSDNTNGAKYFNTDKATLEEWKDWLAEQYANETPVILAYILATPSKTEITETTLINQLEAIRKAQSYDDQTNITQTNEDLPFILNIEALKK